MRTSNVLDAEWESYRDEIYTLLFEQQMKLDPVMEYMKRKGLTYSKHQWIDRLKKWGFDRNIDEEEWERINHHWQHWKERKHSQMAGEPGEDLVVALTGVRKSENQIKKGISRHCRPAFKRHRYELSSITPTPKQSSLLIYIGSHTPWPKNLPWFQFHDRLLQAIGAVRIEQLQQGPASILLPFVQSLSNNAQEESALITIPEAPLLGRRQDPAQIHRLLSCFMPEKHADEHLARTTSICHRGAQWALTTAMEILLFAYSNNLAELFAYRSRTNDEEDSRFLAIVESFLTIEPLIAMLKDSQTIPTAQALLDRIFASAVRQCRPQVLKTLVSLGFDITSRVNKRIAVDGYGGGRFPINLASFKGDQNLVEFLLEQGAVFISQPSGSTNHKDCSLCYAISNKALVKKILISQTKVSEDGLLLSLDHLPTYREYRDIAWMILERILDLELTTELKKPLGLLILAIRWEHIKIVEQLVTRIKDLDATCELLSPISNCHAFGWTSSTAIAEAAARGSFKICKMLLDSGAKPDPGQMSKEGSALWVAALYGHLEVISLLCSRGADINRKCLRCLTALNGTIRQNNTLVAEHLLLLGAKPSDDDLVLVAKSENINLARRLLSIKKEISHEALMAIAAAEVEDIEMADLFSEFGAKWHRRDSRGDSPLARAIMSRHSTLVSRLLEARPCRYDPAALLAATYIAAVSYKTDTSTFSTFLNERRSPPRQTWVESLEGVALVTAVHHGHEATLVPLLECGFALPQRFLMSHGRNLDRFEWKGRSLYLNVDFSPSSPLLYSGMTLLGAAALGLEGDRMVNFLLKRGYCPNTNDISGAAEKATQQTMECLLDAVPSDLDRTHLEATLLPTFIGRGWTSLVEALLEKRVDVNIGLNFPCRRNPIMTPLQAAAWSGNLELVRKLIEHGARVNDPASADRGATALQFAAFRGSMGVVKLLMENKANCNAPGAELDGRTAIEGAAEHGRLDVLVHLLLNGAETEGEHRGAYVCAVKRAELECQYAAANLLRGCRTWTEEGHRIYSMELPENRSGRKYEYEYDLDSEEDWEVFSDEDSTTSDEEVVRQYDMEIDIEQDGESFSDEESITTNEGEVQHQDAEANYHGQHYQYNCEQNVERANVPNTEEFFSSDMGIIEGMQPRKNASGLGAYMEWDGQPAEEHSRDGESRTQDHFSHHNIPDFYHDNEVMDEVWLIDAVRGLEHAPPPEGAQLLITGTTESQDLMFGDEEDWGSFLNDL